MRLITPPRAASRRLLFAAFLLLGFPSQGLAVEAGASDAEVAESTGAARLSVPIDAPKGTGGFEPTLMLSYSSDVPDGPFGVGWGLALGDVRRSVRFGTPAYDATDEFEIDGELLVRAGTTNRYHTSTESFWRILRDPAGGAANSWEVTFPDGTTARYGVDANTRIDHDAGAEGTFRWLLAELEDVNGNTVRVSYDRSDEGTAYPETVEYTYRNGTLVGGVARRISFLLEVRPDTSVHWAGGVKTVVTRRVYEIQSTVDGGAFRRRTLGYDASGYATGRSRIVSTQLFGSDCALSVSDPETGCSGLPAQSFSYTDASSLAPGTSTQWSASSWTLPVSFNGGTGDQTGKDYGVRMADVNGDGLFDLVRAFKTSTGSEIHEVYLGNGAGWDAAADPAWSAALASLSFTEQRAKLNFDNTYGNLCSISTPNHSSKVFFSEHRYWGNQVDQSGTTITFDPPVRARILDVNSDGLADIVVSYNVGGGQVAQNCSAINPTLKTVAHKRVRVVFVNDGSGWAADTAMAAALPEFHALSSHTGSTWGGQYATASTRCFLVGVKKACIRLADSGATFLELNGDGHPDVVARRGALYTVNPEQGAWLNLADGTGWSAAASGYALPFSLIERASTLNATHLNGDTGGRFFDVNGDGLADLVKTALGEDSGENPVLRGLIPDYYEEGIWFNTGSGWCGPSDGCAAEQAGLSPLPVPFSRNGADYGEIIRSSQLAPVDLNGDSLLDLVRTDGTVTGGLQAWLYDPAAPGGSVWVPDGRFEPPSGMESTAVHDFGGTTGQLAVSTGVRMADVDGNGTPDFVRAYGGTTAQWESLLDFSDRMSSVDNGQGGLTEFEYVSALVQRDNATGGLEELADAHADLSGEGDGTDDSRARWSPSPVVSTIRVTGLDGGPYETTLRYARPRWCPIMRSGLGYRLVESTQPDGSISRVYFWQHHGRAGQPANREILSGGQTVWSSEATWLVADGGTVPGSLAGVNVGRPVYESQAAHYAGAEGARRSLTYVYDDQNVGYNFVAQVVIDRPTGSMTVTRTPYFDPSTWLVGLVATERHESGGVVYRDMTYGYEPGRGLLSQIDRVIQPRTLGATPTGTATVSATYDAYGNMISRTEPAGQTGTRTRSFCYDGDAVVGGSACPGVATATHTVLVGSEDPLGGLNGYTADLATGIAETITRFNGDYASIDLDAFGRLVLAEVQPAGEVLTTVESRSYFDDPANGAGRPYTEVFSEIGGTSGGTIRSAQYFDGLGHVVRTVSDAGGGLYYGRGQQRDFAGRVVRETYDTVCGTDLHCLGIDPETTSPATVLVYDALARLTLTTTPDGTEVMYYGRATRSQPAGAGAGTSFDRVLAKNRNGSLRQQLLDGDRAVWVDECTSTVPASTTVLTGNECGSADQTFYTYEPTGEIDAIYDAIAVATSAYLDPTHAFRHVRDTLGRVTSIEDPDGGTSFTTYNPSGSVASLTNARGQVTSYDYDALGRVTDITRPETAPAVTEHVDYDPHTRKRSHVTGAGYTLDYAYDPFGRLEQKMLTALSRTLILDFQYDLLGRVTKLAYPQSGVVERYTYNGPLLKEVCDLAGSGACVAGAGTHVSEVIYDGLGRVDQVQGPPGILDYVYDSSTHHLTQLSVSGGGSTLLDLTYTYDPAGNIETITDAHAGVGSDGLDATATYEYDHRGRIKSWTRTSTGITRYFAYDPLGNLTGRDLPSAGANPNQFYAHPRKPHAISSRTTGESYTYDADGNMTHREFGATAQELDYDSASRLTCVRPSPGAQCDVSFGYDLDGNRLWETTSTGSLLYADDLYTWDTATNTGTAMIMAFGRRIAERAKANAPLRTAWVPPSWTLPDGLVHRALRLAGVGAGLALFALLWWIGAIERLTSAPVPAAVSLLVATSLAIPAPALAGGGGGGTVARRFVYADHLGSPVLVANANSTVLQRRVFEPFGKVLAETQNPTGESETLFTGQRYQETANLYDFRARWYDPETGRFLSVDPIIQFPTDPQTHNAYGYVRNNPLNNVDPDGLGLFSKVKDFFKKVFDVVKKVGEVIVDVVEKALNALKKIIVIVAIVVVVVLVAIYAPEFLPALAGSNAFGGAWAATGLFATEGGALIAGKATAVVLYANAAGQTARAFDEQAKKADTQESQSGQQSPLDDGRVEEAISPIDILLGVGSVFRRGIVKGLGSIFSRRGAGEVASQSVDDLARAAGALDRGGLTAAGRALSKKAGRPGSAFPKPSGNPAQINRTAQGIVDDILRNPASTTSVRETGRFGRVTDVIAPDGRGLRFDASGRFIGLLEP